MDDTRLKKIGEEVREIEELKFETEAKKRIQSARRAHALNRIWLANLDVRTVAEENVEELREVIAVCEGELKCLKDETTRLNSRLQDLRNEERGIEQQQPDLQELEVFSRNKELIKPSVIDNGDLATRKRATKLLAELAPRYQLQYKIDLALQKLQMDERAQPPEHDEPTSGAQETQTLETPEFYHDRTVSMTTSESVTSSGDDVTNLEDDITATYQNHDVTSDYVAYNDVTDPKTDVIFDNDIEDNSDVTEDIDDVPPVPKPRKKRKPRDSPTMEVAQPVVYIKEVTSEDHDVTGMTSREHEVTRDVEVLDNEIVEQFYDDVETSSASDVTSSIDENEEVTTRYSYDVTNDGESLSEEDSNPNVLQHEVSVVIEAMVDDVTENNVLEESDVTEESNNDITEPFEHIDDLTDTQAIIEHGNDVTIDSVNDITDAERDFAPNLAHCVVTEGIREATAVGESPRDVSGFASDRDPVQSNVNVTKEVADVESSADSKAVTAVNVLQEDSLLDDCFVPEEHVTITEDRVTVEQDDVTEKATSSEVTSPNLVIVEYPDVLSDVTEEEMRIIERTGLVNRDEVPEDPNARVTYNAAHSQRNTDATKWFGQAKPKDKVWLKPKGKVDDSAETERRKVIKAMTKKHNPNYVPKWKPPVEKKWEDTLDENKKESLKKYEERRRQRIESSSAHSTSSSSDVTSASEVSISIHSASLSELCPNSEVVVESNVHSKDAINLWESKLSDKFAKQETENKRLSVGKWKRAQRQAQEKRERTESMSSVLSNGSVTGDLPTSENVIRESLGVSNIMSKLDKDGRDDVTRWRNIEHQSQENKSLTNFRKTAAAPRRTNSFTVTPGSGYRSFASPTKTAAPASPKVPTSPEGPPVNSARYSQPIPGESFIDREIRESAEREEQWKHEKLEPEIDRLSMTSSNESTTYMKLPSGAIYSPTLSPAFAMTYVSVTNDKSVKSPPPKYLNKEEKSVTSDVSTDVTSQRDTMTSPHDVFQPHTEQTEYMEQHDHGADSGIECNAPNPVRSNVTSPTSDHDRPGSLTTSGGSHEDEYPSSDVSAASHDDTEVPAKPQQKTPYSHRVASVVTPRGWNPKSLTVGPVSPKHKFFNKQPPLTPTPTPEVVEQEPIVTETKEVMSHNDTNKQPPQVEETSLKVDKSIIEQNPQATVKQVTVTRQRSGPTFDVVSSKNRLQTIMELELKEAEKREQEWKQKQIATLEGSSQPAKEITEQTHKQEKEIQQEQHTPKQEENTPKKLPPKVPQRRSSLPPSMKPMMKQLGRLSTHQPQNTRNTRS
uniref:muscle M-line assembly protein unc-89 isoform X3 n=1 Tax=Ciona intestinalis TaxID=7719 RepID=UPI000EF509B5|nr:muscle M-line assembly protein unc-89 isoform X3 [Ciona intestinalis]|eukprot:XP_026694661.1 muscle M-line assembly protein unc-89 isoform X3 [Ciona intestinalis]